MNCDQWSLTPLKFPPAPWPRVDLSKIVETDQRVDPYRIT